MSYPERCWFVVGFLLFFFLFLHTQKEGRANLLSPQWRTLNSAARCNMFTLHSLAVCRQHAAKDFPRWMIHSSLAKDKTRTNKKNLSLTLCVCVSVCVYLPFGSTQCLLHWISQLPKFRVQPNNKCCHIVYLLPGAIRSRILGQ